MPVDQILSMIFERSYFDLAGFRVLGNCQRSMIAAATIARALSRACGSPSRVQVSKLLLIRLRDFGRRG
jgi:hypothetical protein